MSRYEKMFARLNEKNQGAFVPFVTVCDPNAEQSYKIMEALVESGADALELGIPFSDPLADGPTIQGANIRALDSGATPDICFEQIGKIRAKYPDLPIGLLMYANLVYSRGIESFYERCAKAGIDSVLIADVPTNESAEFVAAAEKFGIHPIFIAPPTASDETLKQVSELGGGYTYLLFFYQLDCKPRNALTSNRLLKKRIHKVITCHCSNLLCKVLTWKISNRCCCNALF